jgi:hypothetical protein
LATNAALLLGHAPQQYFDWAKPLEESLPVIR